MSAAKHTPGLLVRDARGYPNADIVSASGRPVAVTWGVYAKTPKTAAAYQARTEEARANADRLVAAWNACDGISTEALADGAVAGLLAALQEAVRSEIKGRTLLAKCEAAIAKVTGAAL